MAKMGKIGEQKRYIDTKNKAKAKVQTRFATVTTSTINDIKPIPRAWEKFDFLIPGVNIKEIEHFREIHRQAGLRNESQTLRMILYRYDENNGTRNTQTEDKE